MNLATRESMRWLGAALAVAGILLALHAALLANLGRPPSNIRIVDWVSDNSLTLQLLSETYAFAAVAIVPGLIALWSLAQRLQRRAAFATACGLLAASVSVLLLLTVISGGLGYRLWSIALGPEAAAVRVTTLAAVDHLLALLCAAAAVLFALAFRGSMPARFTLLAAASALAQLISAYPEQTGQAVYLASALVFPTWILLLGSRIALGETIPAELHDTANAVDPHEQRDPVRPADA